MRKVVEGFQTTGQPVGSKALAADPDIACGPSTVRNELAVLEELGLLAHPHTSAGRAPTDAGLADWAGSYLNERLVGLGLGARTLRSRLGDPTLPPTERAFLEQLAPAFTELARTADTTLYFDGAARLMADYRFQDVTQLNALLELLERRVSLLGLLTEALSERDIYVRIGAENAMPALRSLSLVAANYGLPQRNLGTVSVVGPTRMDYRLAIATVREAAHQLSRFIEDVYEES